MARKISMRQAINEALDQEMARDPTVFVMGEDIVGGAGGEGEVDAWGGAARRHQGPLSQASGPRARHAALGIGLSSARQSVLPPAACARLRN